MWDATLDYNLSAKYDPLKTGRGKAGLRKDVENDDESMTSAISSSGESKTSKTSKNMKSSKKGYWWGVDLW